MKVFFKFRLTLIATLFTTISLSAQTWKVAAPSNLPEKRNESGMGVANGKVYLLGGRGIKPVNEYDPQTNAWKSLSPPPIEMHHFQAVSYKDEIYVLGALTGGYPHETPIPNVYVFNPAKNEWRKGPEIPNRRRGSAGAFVYNDRIFLVCGIQDGHWDGHVNWFDEFDPATGIWRTFPSAPRARDHVQVAVLDGKLYVAGGRLSTARTGQILNTCIKETDVFDFATKKWSTVHGGNIPTLRAGNTTVVFDDKILLIGGESDAHVEAHNEAEAFNPKTMKWETLPPLIVGRHGTQGVVLNKKVYIAAGSGNRGGGPELDEMEILEK